MVSVSMAPPPVPSLNLKKLGVTPNPEAGRARFDPFGTSGDWSVPQEIARQQNTAKAVKGDVAGKREEGGGGEKKRETTVVKKEGNLTGNTRTSVAQTGQPHEPNVAKGGAGSLKNKPTGELNVTKSGGGRLSVAQTGQPHETKGGGKSLKGKAAAGQPHELNAANGGASGTQSKPAGQSHELNVTKGGAGRRKPGANEQLKARGSSSAVVAQRNATGGETKTAEKNTMAPRSATDAMEPKAAKAKAPVVQHHMEAPPSRPRDSVATLLGGAGASANANAGAKAPRGRQSRKEMEGELVPALPSEAERRKAASAARDPGRRQAVATVPSAKGKSLWGSSHMGLSHGVSASRRLSPFAGHPDLSIFVDHRQRGAACGA